jgi:hypothetical protein
VGGAAIVAAVVALAWLVFQRAVYEPPRRPAPLAVAAPERAAQLAPEPPAPPVAVVTVVGSVERSGPDGRWTAVAAGDRLELDASLRTGAAAHADLAVGAGSRVVVAERSQLAVREVTATVHRLRLSRGRVAVDHAADGARVLRIEDASGRRVVESRAGRFSVLASGATLTVATEAGSATLAAAGAVVDVPAGQHAVAAAGPPSAAARIPVALLLKVADAARRAGDDLCASVDGRASPGAEVTVDGRPAPVDAEGRFSVVVRRRRGLTAVRAETRDASGRTATREVPCREEEENVDGLSVRWKT